MKNLSDIQQALINIFRVSIEESSLEELVRTCHLELRKLMGEDKTRNFYLALYMGDTNYVMPYYEDEEDNDQPFNIMLDLEGGLTEYVRKIGRAQLVDKKRVESLRSKGKVKDVVGTQAFEWVGVPLIYGGEVHGVLVIQTYDKRVHYSKDDVELLDYVTKNIALAIERKEKFQELNQYKENLEKVVREKSKELLEKNKELENRITVAKKSEKIQKVLYNISEAKSKTADLKELLGKIHEQVGTLMDATNFYVAIVVDKEKGLYKLPYLVDQNPKEMAFAKDTVNLKGGFTHYVIQSENPLLADEEKTRELQENGSFERVGTASKSWLGIPLKTDGGEILGVVAVQSYTDPNAYSRTDLEVLSIISSTIAGAVKYKQLDEEKESLEEKLVESQKMEAVGVLAAGVAHEFNNLLSIIIGHAYNGMRLNKGNESEYQRYKKIEKTGEQAAELIEKLMVFAKKRERGRHFITDVSRAVRSAVRTVMEENPNKCRIDIDIKEELWPVRVAQEEIDDVLKNILDNALRAVDEKTDGYVLVSAENFRGRPAHSSLKEASKYIYIRIQDNGHGMDEKTRKHIFNPFFTTRPPGQGTGMGLAIVYTIVKEYYGSIEVESEEGKGTVFHIYLPITSFLS